jgi:hypothetical protein
MDEGRSLQSLSLRIFFALLLLFHFLGDQWIIVTPNSLPLFAQTVRVSEAFTPE